MGLCLSRSRTTGSAEKKKLNTPKVDESTCKSPPRCPTAVATVAATAAAVEVKIKKEVVPVVREISGGRKKKEEDVVAVEELPRRSYKEASGVGAAVRTSSCTKEELDAILIQCGRLSRSSSGKAGAGADSGDGGRPRRYSGSKRSYDFDAAGEESGAGGSVATPVHRRASSRERDGSGRRSHLKRSSSAGDEGRRGGERRRASRSPRRRSETPTESGKRPARMVSVPATTGSVKRSMPAGSGKGTASPRSRSPATGTGHQPSLSRSSSRKGEQSPYRRTPLGEIDDNALNIRANMKPTTISTANKLAPPNNHETLTFQQRSIKHERKLDACSGSDGNSSAITSKLGIRDQLTNYKSNSKEIVAESFNPMSLTRSRSQRKSRDLDLLLNPSTIASMLIEDGQNLSKHEAIIGFTLPPCVSKACSILEAVADLNSCANSTRSAASTGGKNTPEHSDRTFTTGLNEASKTKRSHLFVESEVGNSDHNDLMEPSLHKYVTVRGDADMEQQESAGSNSFFFLANGGGVPSWEPNSADSTDRWTKVDQQHFMAENDVPSYSNSEEGGIAGRRRTQISTGHESNASATRPNSSLKMNNQNAKLGTNRTLIRRGAAVA